MIMHWVVLPKMRGIWPEGSNKQWTDGYSTLRHEPVVRMQWVGCEGLPPARQHYVVCVSSRINEFSRWRPARYYKFITNASVLRLQKLHREARKIYLLID